MYELKKIGKLFTSKFVGTGPSSYKKRSLPGRGLIKVEKHCCSYYISILALLNLSVNCYLIYSPSLFRLLNNFTQHGFYCRVICNLACLNYTSCLSLFFIIF